VQRRGVVASAAAEVEDEGGRQHVQTVQTLCTMAVVTNNNLISRTDSNSMLSNSMLGLTVKTPVLHLYYGQPPV
jgi:hypothetical protein